jgi:hypothetical protein
VKHGLRGVRSISDHALDRIGVRSLLPMFERRRAFLALSQLRLIADVVRSSAPTEASHI